MQTDILKSVCGTCIFFARCLRCFTTKVKHVNKEIEAFMKINHPDVLGNVPLKYLRRTKDRSSRSNVSMSCHHHFQVPN